MSTRGLLLAAVLLAVLAGAVYWSERTKTAEENKDSTASKLVSIKDDDLNRLEIRRLGAEPVVVERGKNNQWQMKSPETFRLDGDAVSSLVTSFTGLTQDRVIDEKPMDLSAFGLGTPSIEVTGTAKNGTKQTLLIGDDTPTGSGVYAKLDNQPRVFTLSTGTKSSFDKTARDLRDKRLLTFDSEKLTRVELNSKGSVIEFGKNNQNEWSILKPRPLRADNYGVDELVRKLKDARMESTGDEEDAKAAAAKFAAAPRVGVATVTDNSGTQTLEIHKSGEDYYAKSSVVEGVHKVSKDIGEALGKGIEEYRNKKLFDFGFTDPSKLDLSIDGKSYSFVKGGEKWWANGKEVDVTSVQSLIDKLRELSATKFADAGFTTPSTEITVTSNDGKRVEKVLISKTGESYFAKRENEPAIYELDAKALEEIGRAAADVKPPSPPPAPPK